VHARGNWFTIAGIGLRLRHERAKGQVSVDLGPEPERDGASTVLTSIDEQRRRMLDERQAFGSALRALGCEAFSHNPDDAGILHPLDRRCRKLDGSVAPSTARQDIWKLDHVRSGREGDAMHRRMVFTNRSGVTGFGRTQDAWGS
jgi:hypothetical protein